MGVVPDTFKIDRPGSAVVEVVAGRGVAAGHAPFVLADPGAVPPRSEQAVEPLPLMSREPVLVEHLMEVGELTLTVTGGPRVVVEPPEQVCNTGQGVVEGGPRREEFPYARAGNVPGYEDQVKPAVRCERAGNRDPSRRAQEPIVLPLHRRIRRVVAGVCTPRRLEELADDTGPRIGKLVAADNVRRGLYPVNYPALKGGASCFILLPIGSESTGSTVRSTPDTPTRF